jgi:hypothetical protein
VHDHPQAEPGQRWFGLDLDEEPVAVVAVDPRHVQAVQADEEVTPVAVAAGGTAL